MGTVASIETSSGWNAGKRTYDYHVNVDYQPQGKWGIQSISENYSFNKFSKGDTVPVLYQKNKVYKAYVAKKDWITQAYLPVSKNYNTPFIISIVLFIIGILFYTNSPILQWYAHAGEITIGKKKKS